MEWTEVGIAAHQQRQPRRVFFQRVVVDGGFALGPARLAARQQLAEVLPTEGGFHEQAQARAILEMHFGAQDWLQPRSPSRLVEAGQPRNPVPVAERQGAVAAADRLLDQLFGVRGPFQEGKSTAGTQLHVVVGGRGHGLHFRFIFAIRQRLGSGPGILRLGACSSENTVVCIRQRRGS